ncbi:MAG TPA: ABC transporter ATP-binding protein [Gemmatimonadales bacterium]|nr:ABC transporter ATP-binding protein [Gemmatimonadales bacterium]
MAFSLATPAFSPKSPDRARAAAVELRGVSKRFYYYEHRTSSLREWFIRRVLQRPLNIRRAEFTLRNLNLRVARGESVALIGSNGSGKSTALRLIAGIYQASSGTIKTQGRLTAVIELGAGFHPELTGADNVSLYAAVLGIGRRELSTRYEEIVDFAQTREFMDTPLKYYSSGMEARLAFAVAVCLQPDVLLLDEVLAVGDQLFRERCLSRLREYHASGGTLILVSHEIDQVRELCSRAVWLEHGVIRMDGEVGAVLTAYSANDPSQNHRGAR